MSSQLHSPTQTTSSTAEKTAMMKPRSVLYILALVLVVVFVLANWGLLSGSVQLNLLIARIQAPLGLLILLISAIVIAVDLTVHAMSRRAWRRERRTLLDDMGTIRQRAEHGEESRLEELRVALDRELTAIRGQLDRLTAGQGAPERDHRIAEPTLTRTQLDAVARSNTRRD